ncbi:hypothetical protein FKP32DRAFT_1677429 [Trametes sanguinea]|nr:hypothetical protein FKP32DRAFT_1677429 [Trametes sanguinea]
MSEAALIDCGKMSSYTETSPLSTLFRSLQTAIEVGLRTESRDEILRVDAVASNILLALRVRANSLVAVHKLPPEILLDVFKNATLQSDESWPNSDSRDDRRVSARTLVQLTHVCKRWRNVALTASILWTRIDDANPERMVTFSRRSGSAPISMRLTQTDPHRIVRIMEEHAHRLTRLDLTLTSTGRFIGPLFTCETPLLRFLTISTPYNPNLNPESGPVPLFRQTYDCGIQALAIRMANSRWLPENHFSRLTHLYLSTRFYNPCNSKLLLLLSHTPSLQHLHLAQFDHDEPFNAAEPLTPSVIPLPSLRSLTCLESTLTVAMTLLTTLKFPRDVLVRFDPVACIGRTPPPRRIPSQAWLSSLAQPILVADTAARICIIAEGFNSGLYIQVDTTVGSFAGFDWDFWGPWLMNDISKSAGSIRALARLYEGI